MNAAAVNKDHRTALYAANITKPAIISAVLHISIFLLATVGLPYMSKDIQQPDMVIPVELFDPSELIETTKIDEPEKNEEADIVPPPERKPVYNNTDSIPDLAVPEEPDIEEIIPEEPPKLVPADPSIIKKPPKPKSKPKPPKRVQPAPEKPVEDKRDMTSLLKDLTPSEPDKTKQVTENDSGQGQTSQMGKLSEHSMSSMENSLNNAVMKCWRVNAGAKFAESIAVDVLVFMRRNKTVREVQIVDKSSYNSDPRYRAAADSAVRALMNKNCQPYELPSEQYEIWKKFIYNFDPSEML